MTAKTSNQKQEELLTRIAVALEHLAGVAPPPSLALPAACHAFLWQTKPDSLRMVDTAAIPLPLLCGIDRQAETLFANSQRFARGLPANHALLWGARGIGKSSLIKSLCAEINQSATTDKEKLTLVEIYRQDIASLPCLLAGLTPHTDRRFIIFCDDLAFDVDEGSYKSLKAVLEGGLLATPRHVLFYATSNRRHMMGQTMQDSEDRQDQHTISGRETIDERVSLSDRFGLWLGFYAIDQATYLQMITRYAHALGLVRNSETLKALQKEALEWARSRGDMSGRVAWQFIVDAAGKAGLSLEFNQVYLRQLLQD